MDCEQHKLLQMQSFASHSQTTGLSHALLNGTGEDSRSLSTHLRKLALRDLWPLKFYTFQMKILCILERTFVRFPRVDLKQFSAQLFKHSERWNKALQGRRRTCEQPDTILIKRANFWKCIIK